MSSVVVFSRWDVGRCNQGSKLCGTPGCSLAGHEDLWALIAVGPVARKCLLGGKAARTAVWAHDRRVLLCTGNTVLSVCPLASGN